MNGSGTMRGFFDYRGTQRTPNIASVTDGTSNSIIVGEVLPSNAADNNFWMFNGSYAGTTVPLGFNSNTIVPVAGGPWSTPPGSLHPPPSAAGSARPPRDSSACTPAARTSHSPTDRSVS